MVPLHTPTSVHWFMLFLLLEWHRPPTPQLISTHQYSNPLQDLIQEKPSSDYSLEKCLVRCLLAVIIIAVTVVVPATTRRVSLPWEPSSPLYSFPGSYHSFPDTVIH